MQFTINGLSLANMIRKRVDQISADMEATIRRGEEQDRAIQAIPKPMFGEQYYTPELPMGTFRAEARRNAERRCEWLLNFAEMISDVVAVEVNLDDLVKLDLLLVQDRLPRLLA